VTAALRYELVRIRTIASSYWMTGLALFLTVALSVILLLVVNSELPDHLSLPEATTWVITGGASAAGAPVLAAVFFAVMGAMAMGHEYRYGTNKTTLSAVPDRVAVLVAKALVLVGWVVLSTLLILVVDLLLAGLFLQHFDLAGVAVRPIVNYVAYCVGFALAGMSLATIFRNQVGAIVTVLVWPLVIEVIALTVMRVITINTDVDLSSIYNLLPASAGRRTMFSPYNLFAQLDISTSTGVWGLTPSLLVFWAAISALFAFATFLFVRRDA
jgi:ABC-type transport system involved in multi-copper enzyme maturation permease subunit